MADYRMRWNSFGNVREYQGRLQSRHGSGTPRGIELPSSLRDCWSTFTAKKTSNGLVGWAVVQSDKQKDFMQKALKDSRTLNLLQVEKLTREFEAILKQEND